MDSSSSSANSSREREQCRISLEKMSDWNEIQQNFSDALVESLDRQLGPDGSKEDRETLMAHLMEWKDRTFETAKPNVQVNGINMEDCEEEEESELEPYDEALDRRLWTEFEMRMEWLTTLAIRRRQDPLHAERLVEDLILRERAFDAEVAPDILDPNHSAGGKAEAIPEIERFEEIADTHQDAVEMLRTWNESAPKLLEKVSRLENVIAAESKLTP